jgi:hypothetical protein
MKKLFAIIGALITGAMGLSVLVPGAVEAAMTTN